MENKIKRVGAVIFSEYSRGEAVKKLAEISREDVLFEIKESKLKGRGGAGFPTATKWMLTAAARGSQKYVICNADEGEPGTFKDRVLLSEYPELVFDGMVVAGYTVGAKEGIVYLRGEYEYLLKSLNDYLVEMRKDNLLGKNIAGKEGFDFDITIRLGAGAYVCGEETALIESLEGQRGEARNRPPFPVNTGYKKHPTTVNNVETLAAEAHIVVKGGIWLKEVGTSGSNRIFNQDRSMLHVLKNFMECFQEESCGQCTPCRIGNTKLLEGVEMIESGDFTFSYINKLKDLGRSMQVASKCGLGQSSPNPFLSILENFKDEIFNGNHGGANGK